MRNPFFFHLIAHADTDSGEAAARAITQWHVFPSVANEVPLRDLGPSEHAAGSGEGIHGAVARAEGDAGVEPGNLEPGCAKAKVGENSLSTGKYIKC